MKPISNASRVIKEGALEAMIPEVNKAFYNIYGREVDGEDEDKELREALAKIEDKFKSVW
jgi:hypothetical protein